MGLGLRLGLGLGFGFGFGLGLGLGFGLGFGLGIEFGLGFGLHALGMARWCGMRSTPSSSICPSPRSSTRRCSLHAL